MHLLQNKLECGYGGVTINKHNLIIIKVVYLKAETDDMEQLHVAGAVSSMFSIKTALLCIKNRDDDGLNWYGCTVCSFVPKSPLRSVVYACLHQGSQATCTHVCEHTK